MNSMFLKPLLTHKVVLVLLFITNLFGTIYGYIWYEPQLRDTPYVYWLFVPDSPTASLFFTVVLGLWIFQKRSPLMETLAFITLIKYGVWAVVMNILFLNKLPDDAETITILMAVMLMVLENLAEGHVVNQIQVNDEDAKYARLALENMLALF